MSNIDSLIKGNGKENKHLQEIQKLLKNSTTFPLNENLLHLACRNQPTNELLKLLIDFGIDINQPNRETPIFYLIWYGGDPLSVKFLIDNGANINHTTNYSPLLYAAQKPSPIEIFEYLLEGNADVNCVSNDSALHYLVRQNTFNYEIISLLILFGADVELKNGKKPEEEVKNEEILEFFQINICSDWKNFLKREEFTDIQIKCLDGELKAHKLIVEKRLEDKNYEKITKLIEISQNKKKEEILPFLKFLYSGQIDSTSQEKIKQILNEILENPKDIEKWIGRKGRKKGFLEDLKKLYEDESTKDFLLKAGNKEIKVHKLVLAARSDLFRGMFLNVNDDSNSVSDYRGKTIYALKCLVEFLYTDEINESTPKSVIEELKDADDFYQFSHYSTFQKQIAKLLKK
ncbi:ankyrin repeat-containing protein [Anaeramoeba ignava]|uniref:Ankyrin repeat-containing protein n=1 Tax=Anaeramoeba ignava TaxID=1746090 RepID=A0A9Q0L7Q7_ANAIG|nr:ankyrin repeat-containing protein [Anaeramoeba ignava]